MKTERTSSQVLGSSIDNGHTPKQCQIVIYQIIYGGLKARFLLVFSRKMKNVHFLENSPKTNHFNFKINTEQLSLNRKTIFLGKVTEK